MNKQDIRKIPLPELGKISGGTPDEAFEYLYELKEQYGVAPEASLEDIMTDEEMDQFAKLFWQGVDTSDMFS